MLDNQADYDIILNMETQINSFTTASEATMEKIAAPVSARTISQALESNQGVASRRIDQMLIRMFRIDADMDFITVRPKGMRSRS